MATAFVLRFQEQCLPQDHSSSPGVKTETRVQGEQPDTLPCEARHRAVIGSHDVITHTHVDGEEPRQDPGRYSLQALPREVRTVTEVGGEGPKNDPKRHRLQILPRSEQADQTQTVTFIKSDEGNDTDRGADAALVLPRYLSSAPTKTATMVKAEMDDQDWTPQSMEAIRKCSLS